MISSKDVESYLVSNYQNEKYYRDFSELSRSDMNDPSTAMVECETKAYSFDKLTDLYLGQNCPHKLCSADALYIKHGAHKDKLYVIEFKTGFNSIITAENYDEEKMKCEKLAPATVCDDYKVLFFKKQEKEKEVPADFLHKKAAESYILFQHSVFPLCADAEGHKDYILIFAAVIDDVKNKPVEAIERVYEGITNPENPNNLVTDLQESIKKYMVRDTSDKPVMYDEAYVWSVEDFTARIGTN